MGCFVTVEITAKKGTGPAVLEAMRAALPITRSRDGCQSLELLVNQDNPENMIVVMRWQSRKHYDTYLAASKAEYVTTIGGSIDVYRVR